MKSKAEILEKHALKLKKDFPEEEYFTLEEMKLTPEWGMILSVMDEHAEIMLNAFLSWYAPTMTPDEVQKVVTGFLSSDYLKELQK
jgi:hypothetical protein